MQQNTVSGGLDLNLKTVKILCISVRGFDIIEGGHVLGSFPAGPPLF